MKKLIGIAIVLALLSFVCSAEAAVGVKKDGVYEGAATNIDIKGGNSEMVGNTVVLFANGYKTGVTGESVTRSVSQESHITSAALAYGVIERIGLDFSDVAGNNWDCTLADGEPGQMVTIMLTGRTSGYWMITDDDPTATQITKTGWDDILFDAVLDSVTLLYVDDSIGWIIVGNVGCTIT